MNAATTTATAVEEVADITANVASLARDFEARLGYERPMPRDIAQHDAAASATATAVEEVADIITANVVASLARDFEARLGYERPIPRDIAQQHVGGPAPSLRNRVGFFDARERLPPPAREPLGRPNPIVLGSPTDLNSRIRAYETCVAAARPPTVTCVPPQSFDGAPSVRARTLAFQAVAGPNPAVGLERPTRVRTANFDAAARYNRAIDAASDGSTVQAATATERLRIEAGSVKTMIRIFGN